MGLSFDRLDRVAVFLVAVIVGGCVFLQHGGGLAGAATAFGFEHGNIASALASGQGFADAFSQGTGPTAWSPPAYPALMALVFCVFGIKSSMSGYVLLLLKIVGYSASAALLIGAARNWTSSRVFVLPVIFTAILLTDWVWVGQSMTSPWLEILCFSLIIHGLSIQEGKVSWSLCLGGALAPLVTPVFALGVAVVVMLRLPSTGRASLIPLVLLGLSGGIWTARNAVVLGSPYPVVSSPAFTLYHVNVADEDGVRTASSIIRFSPVWPNTQAHAEYSELGEDEFSRKHLKLALSTLKSEPGTFLKRIGFRFFHAFIYLRQSLDVSFPIPGQLARKDIEKLAQAGLIFSQPETWLVLGWEEGRVREAIDGLGLENPEAVVKQWKDNRAQTLAHQRQPLKVVHALAVTLLPAVAIALGLLWGFWGRPAFREVAVLYFVYQLFHVLLAHSEAIQAACMPVQAWLIWCLFSMERESSGVPEAGTARARKAGIPLAVGQQVELSTGVEESDVSTLVEVLECDKSTFTTTRMGSVLNPVDLLRGDELLISYFHAESDTYYQACTSVLKFEKGTIELKTPSTESTQTLDVGLDSPGFSLSVELPVEFKASGSSHPQRARTSSIAHGRIGLRSNLPIPLRTQLEITLDEAGLALTTRGVVVACEKDPDGSKHLCEVELTALTDDEASELLTCAVYLWQRRVRSQ